MGPEKIQDLLSSRHWVCAIRGHVWPILISPTVPAFPQPSLTCSPGAAGAQHNSRSSQCSVLCPVKVHRLTQCAVIKPSHRKQCRSPGASWETCCPCGCTRAPDSTSHPMPHLYFLPQQLIREGPTQLHCSPTCSPLSRPGLQSWSISGKILFFHGWLKAPRAMESVLP